MIRSSMMAGGLWRDREVFELTGALYTSLSERNVYSQRSLFRYTITTTGHVQFHLWLAKWNVGLEWP
jgi:hypothetical protein